MLVFNIHVCSCLHTTRRSPVPSSVLDSWSGSPGAARTRMATRGWQSTCSQLMHSEHLDRQATTVADHEMEQQMASPHLIITTVHLTGGVGPGH
jgi:hypothetical protein